MKATTRVPGLRAAAVMYVLVLLLGLGGAGAHALWSQTGSLTSTVTAGSWAPNSVQAASVTCTRQDGNNGLNYSDITVSWDVEGIGATNYTVTSTRNGSPAVSTTTITPPAILRLERQNYSAVTYTITITPKAGNLDATPTSVIASLGSGQRSTVSCTQ